MRSQFFRFAAGLLCLCMLAFTFSGCTDLTFERAQTPAAPLPTPDTSALSAPVGDSRAAYSIRATLYYSTADGKLSSALRLINVGPEDSPLRLILLSLLETPYSSSGLLPIAPAGTALNDIRFSGGIVTVDLSAQALAQGEEQFYLTRAAIAKTLLGLEEVRCVNVLVEGRAAEISSVPLGALTEQDSNAAMGYLQQISELHLLETDGGFIKRQAVLYLPGADGAPLAPQCADVRLDNKDVLPALIGTYLSAMDPGLFPQDLLGRIGAELGMTDAGERYMELRLPEELSAYAPQDRLIPGLILSLCAFVPNVNIARVRIGTEPLTVCGGVSAREDGSFDPQLFLPLVGSTAKMFFLSDDGSLAQADHVVPGCSPSVRALLSGLMQGPNAGDGDALCSVFPESARPEDILGVHVEDGTAHINLSAALYSACQSFTPEQERALVYSIVNTLVANSGTILRVQFYIDGAVADTFAGTISIRTPLMANPGLVR